MVTKKKTAPKHAKKGGPIVVRGKRKESVARASIKKGNGKVRVNRMLLSALTNPYEREIINEPLTMAPAVASQINVQIEVHGGGSMGQAQAARTALARALVKFTEDADLKSAFMKRDRFIMLEDSRRVEPKKYKGPKARARFQKSYR